MKSKIILSVFTLFFLLSEFAFAYDGGGDLIFPLLLFFFILFFNITFIELAILKGVRKRIKLSIWEIISSPAAFIITLIILYVIYLVFGFKEVTPYGFLVFYLFLLYITRFLFIYLGIRVNSDKNVIKKLILINVISFMSFCILLSVFN